MARSPSRGDPVRGKRVAGKPRKKLAELTVDGKLAKPPTCASLIHDECKKRGLTAKVRYLVGKGYRVTLFKGADQVAEFTGNCLTVLNSVRHNFPWEETNATVQSAPRGPSDPPNAT